MARSLALLLVVTGALTALCPRHRAHAQDCRDATGEPAPCPSSAPVEPSAVSVEIVASYEAPAAAPVIEAPAPAPEEELSAGEVGYPGDSTVYVGYSFFLEATRPRGLHFTQVDADRAPELARDALVLDVPDVMVGGLTFAIGARPLPWLRLPEFRFSLGGGDFETAPGTWGDGTQTMGATLSSLLVLRAEVGAGFELPIDDFSLYAMGHVGISAYIMEARLDHPTAGGLGAASLAEDAWEAGWTVGMAWRIGDGLRLGASYRHIHTGAESDQASFTVEWDGR